MPSGSPMYLFCKLRYSPYFRACYIPAERVIMLTMENLTRYLGLVIILIGAIVVIVAMAMGEPSNTMLGTGAILAVVGLLVQIFIGRSSD